MSPKYAPSSPTCPVCLTSPCGQEIMSGLSRLRREEYVFLPSVTQTTTKSRILLKYNTLETMFIKQLNLI